MFVNNRVYSSQIGKNSTNLTWIVLNLRAKMEKIIKFPGYAFIFILFV